MLTRSDEQLETCYMCWVRLWGSDLGMVRGTSYKGIVVYGMLQPTASLTCYTPWYTEPLLPLSTCQLIRMQLGRLSTYYGF